MNTDATYLKYKDRLIMCGEGIILLGVWGFVRNIMIMVLYRSDMVTFFMSQVDSVDDVQLATTIMVSVVDGMILLFSLIGFFFYYFIGKGARREGLENRKKNGYLIGALVMMYASIGAIINLVTGSNYDLEDSGLQMFGVSVFSEVMTVVMILTMLHAVYVTRRMDKKEGK